MKSTCLILGAISAAKASLFEDIEPEDRQLQQFDDFSADDLLAEQDWSEDDRMLQ